MYCKLLQQGGVCEADCTVLYWEDEEEEEDDSGYIVVSRRRVVDKCNLVSIETPQLLQSLSVNT